MRAGTDQTPLGAGRTVSRAFLKAVLRKRAVDSWKREIERRGQGRRPY